MAKVITLSAPAIIGGAVRFPFEGAMTVFDETAATLDANGQIATCEDGEPDGSLEAAGSVKPSAVVSADKANRRARGGAA